jgi:hypothetical protein
VRRKSPGADDRKHHLTALTRELRVGGYDLEQDGMWSMFMKKAGVVALALALGAAATVLGITSASAKILPALPKAFIAAVNKTDLTIVVATPAQASVATVPEEAAVGAAERANGRGSWAVAASLVELTNAQYPKAHLVWGVDTEPVGEGMFLVELVDAKTGNWLEGDSGYYSPLPPPVPGHPWPGSAVVAQSDLAAVSCAGPLACVAIGQQGLSPHASPVLVLGKPGRPLAVMVGQTAAVIGGAAAPVLSGWDALSCTSPEDCVAVADGYAGVFDGTHWQAEALPVPADATRASRPAYQLVLSSVSCAGPNDCMAVGRYTGAGGRSGTLAERLVGHNWSVSPTVQPPGGGPSYAAELSSVSCPSASSCVAVGDYYYDARDKAIAEVFTHGHWTMSAVLSPGKKTTTLVSVACQVGPACTAVGYFYPTGAIAESLRQGRWSLSSAPSHDAVGLATVSCPATGWCLAVGQAPGPCCRVVIEEFVGGRWAMAPSPLVPFEGNPSVQLQVHAIACPRPGSCLVVGSDLVSGRTIVTDPVIERLADGKWEVVRR